MKLHETKVYLMGILFLFCCVFFLNKNIYGYYACGGSPCNATYTCNAGLTCNGSSICGQVYDACSGATCVDNGGWNASTCNSVSCTNFGTTRTPIWTYAPASCPTNCGLNTRFGTCTDQAQNNCPPARCTAPDGAVGGTYTDTSCACVSSAPVAPTSITVVENNPTYVNPTRVDVGWSFGLGGVGCGNEWGYVCGSPAYSFTLKIDGADSVTGISSAARTTTITVGSWGSHTTQVCALNGYATTCSTVKAFTITAPVCSVNGQSPTSGCYSSFPELSATIGNGASQIQYAVDDESGFLNPWTCNSGWIPEGAWNGCNPLVTDRYYWSARSQSTTSPLRCTASSLSPIYTIDVDKTAPTIPVPTVVLPTDGACLGKYNVLYSWDAVADGGCSGLNSTPYSSQGSSNAGFSSLLFGWSEDWTNTRSQKTATSYSPGTNLYFRVMSRDALSWQSAWSATSPVTIPTPSPYPTIHVSGPLSEDINRTCNPMTLTSNFTIEPEIVPALGVTPICPTLAPGASTYSCNFIINNQTGLCVSPNIQVTLNGSYSGYGTIGWRSGAGGGVCSGYPASRSYSAGNSDTSVPLYFTYNAILPTQSPPGVTPPVPPNVAGWFKLSQTSYISRQSGRQNFIPNYIQKYDTDDATTNHNLMIGRSSVGSSGLLLQNGPLDPGANGYTNGTVTYSSNNWYTNNYATTNNISYSNYIEYIKSRKDYKTITALSEINTSGIYSIATNITLDQNNFDGKNVVLVVANNMTASINTNFKPPNNGSVAVLAGKIEIDPAVTEINAILIGQSVTMGSSVNPIKIVGNLIDEEEAGVTVERARNDGSRPSLFVVFDPQTYLNLLPYLSTSTYDWKQIQ
ncbi:MAG: hypothetical protein V1922_00565 [bacterium]